MYTLRTAFLGSCDSSALQAPKHKFAACSQQKSVSTPLPRPQLNSSGKGGFISWQSHNGEQYGLRKACTGLRRECPRSAGSRSGQRRSGSAAARTETVCALKFRYRRPDEVLDWQVPRSWASHGNGCAKTAMGERLLGAPAEPWVTSAISWGLLTVDVTSARRTARSRPETSLSVSRLGNVFLLKQCF